jgi:hypothetical protein
MSKWSSPRRVVFLSAVGIAAILILINLASWLSGLGCYNSLYLGMPENEATAIMQQNGYKVVNGSFRLFAVTEVYSRNRLEPPIVLVFSDGVLKYKERSCPPDYFLQCLSDRLRR